MPRKPLPSSDKKVPLNSRVDPAIFAAVKAVADADDRTLSYTVEKLLREYFASHHGKLPKPKR